MSQAASDLEADPLQRSHTFSGPHGSPQRPGAANATHDALRSSPLRGTQSAEQVSRRRTSCVSADQGRSPLSVSNVQHFAGAALSSNNWLEAEALLAELPARLANVAIVLKAHVWPAMTAMPHAIKEGLQVRALAFE